MGHFLRFIRRNLRLIKYLFTHNISIRNFAYISIFIVFLASSLFYFNNLADGNLITGFATYLIGANESPSADVLTISYSEELNPLILELSTAYYSKNPNVKLSLNSAADGATIEYISKGVADIGIVSRDIFKKEIARYPDIIYNKYHLASDAVIIAVSSNLLKDLDKISVRDLYAIYAGDKKTWIDFTDENNSIKVYGLLDHKEKKIFSELINHRPDRTVFFFEDNSEAVMYSLLHSDYGIAYLSWKDFGYLQDNVIPVENSVGEPVFPTPYNILKNRYPLSKKIYIIANLKNVVNQNRSVSDFINFILASDEILIKNGYIPAH